MYGSMEEAFDKAEFYLRNEELLREIANNGHERTKECFNYPDKIEEITKLLNEK